MKTKNTLKNFLLLAVFTFSLNSYLFGQLPLTNTTAGTYTSGGGGTGWLCPAGITCVRVQIWGGGGGGGGNNSGADGGGGGGGGGYSEGYVTVVPGTRYAYTVGAAGAGVSGASGTAGGQSFFINAATLFANGGGLGVSGQGSDAGGAGGTAGGTSSTINFTGGLGGNGNGAAKGRGGGGGSSAAPIFAGADGTDAGGTPGVGGTAAAGGGNGGNGGNRDINGFAGSAPGGGGGGSGEDNGSGDRIGGNGGAGQIMITASQPNCPLSTAVTSPAAQSVCQATAVTTLTAVSTTSGGCGTPTVLYQWYSNTGNSNTVAGATLIGGATASTYTPPSAVLGTLYYFCVAYATDNGCAQTNATQSLASNAVSITIVVSVAPSASNAGAATSICTGSNTVLGANNPASGTGTWSISSGPSTSTTQFSSTTNRNATFTPSAGAGSYVLVWTISTGSCQVPTTSSVTITVTCGGACPACPAPYTHPTSGYAGEYVGNCLVATCSGTYTDDGGAGANYSSSVTAIYRVFCPTNAGQCMRATFNTFDVQPPGVFYTDYLTIGNGPTQNSTVFTTAPANAVGRIYGTPAVPFSYTSTHASGCLTMRFTSDGSTVRAGWTATLTCAPCAGGPNGTDPSDCVSAKSICADDNTFSAANAKGPGIDAEGCPGVATMGGAACPAGGENFSNWFKVQVLASGTLGFNINPTTGTDDYDYAIYKSADGTCGTLTNTRCSDSADTGATGVTSNTTPGDLKEDVTGDKFTDRIAAVAGETYYIMVDEWTPTGSGFSLDMIGTATLDCIILPVELSEFKVNYNMYDKGVDLYWKTESERDNDFFTIEKSLNGVDFFEVKKVDGNGTKNSATEYNSFDSEFAYGVNYYRLKQTDFNGAFKYSEIRSVNILPEGNDILTLFPNPTTGVTELIFNCYKSETAYLTLIDSEGKVVLNKELDCVSGGNFTEMDLSDFSQGLYFVKVVTSSKTFLEKLVKE